MKYNFSKYILEDIIESFIDYRGKTPKKTNDGIPLITAKIVKKGRLNPIQEYISVEDYNTWMTRGIPKKGSIILTTEAPLGEIAQLKTSEKVAFAQRVIVLYGKEEVVDNDFLKYYFQSKTFQHKLVERETGTTVTGIKSKELKKIEIEIPSDIVVQKKIANILNQLDSKIDLNNQMIDTLEDMASTLFKRWFVDFEFPDENGNLYKSSGGKMIDSELGEIPEGWEIGDLSDISEIIMGQSPKSNTYNQSKEGLPLVNGASDFKQGYIEPLKYTTDPRKITKSDDYIFGVRATIGNVTYVDGEYAIGRGAGIARVREVYYSEYLYFTLNALFDYFTKTATGSVYINVSKKDFEKYQIVIPSIFYMKKYHNTVGSLFYKIRKSREENLFLSRIRDELLPRLLSGNIEL